MSTEEIKKSGEQKMDKCISQLKKELTTIRTGRANPLILDKVLVDYYGAPTKLNQMAQISVQDGTTLVITPFDKTIVKEIEKALIKADLGITPSSDGIVVRLVFPPLTADRRKELSKEVKAMGETAKVAVRNVRRDLGDEIKKIEKAENLLKYCDYSLIEITNYLSFSSQSHFIQLFKEFTGITPKKYRDLYSCSSWNVSEPKKASATQL